MTEVDAIDAFIQALREKVPRIEWAAHRELLQSELVPWLGRHLAEIVESDRAGRLLGLAEEVAADVDLYGEAGLPETVCATATSLRLDGMDGWIAEAARELWDAGSDMPEDERALLRDRAFQMDPAIQALDDDLRARHPGVREGFADQLSEMYLDLEFLQSGTPGSRRLHAYSTARQQTNETRNRGED